MILYAVADDTPIAAETSFAVVILFTSILLSSFRFVFIQVFLYFYIISYILVCQYHVHASLYIFQKFNIFTLIPDADDVTLDMEVTEMKLGDYLEIGKKLKAARTKAGISQRNMASKLELNASTYSNYENGYSEPPVETLEKACAIMGITMKDLLEVPLPGSSKTSVTKFSELLAILIDLDRRGLPITASTTYTQDGNQLTAHLTLDIKNAQLASFIPNWNRYNEKLQKGEIDEEEYQMWLEDTLSLFNVPIDEYLIKK